MVSRYGGGGYVQVLDAEYKIAEEQLKILKQNLWLDRGTRVVFLDLTVYNGNINLFCQIKLTVEFPASGGTVASKSFSTVKLIRVSPRRTIAVDTKIIFSLLVRFIHGLFCFGLWDYIYHLHSLLHGGRDHRGMSRLIPSLEDRFFSRLDQTFQIPLL